MKSSGFQGAGELLMYSALRFAAFIIYVQNSGLFTFSLKCSLSSFHLLTKRIHQLLSPTSIKLNQFQIGLLDNQIRHFVIAVVDHQFCLTFTQDIGFSLAFMVQIHNRYPFLEDTSFIGNGCLSLILYGHILVNLLFFLIWI